MRQWWLLPQGVSPDYASSMVLSPLEILLRIPRPATYVINEAYRLHIVASGGAVDDKWMVVFKELENFAVRPGEGSAAAQRWVQVCYAVKSLCVGPRADSRRRDYRSCVQSEYRVNSVLQSLRDSQAGHSGAMTEGVAAPWSRFLAGLGARLGLTSDAIRTVLQRGEWPADSAASPPVAAHERLDVLFDALARAQVPSDDRQGAGVWKDSITPDKSTRSKRSGGGGRSTARRTASAAAAVGGREPVVYGQVKFTRYASGKGGEYRLLDVPRGDYSDGRSLVDKDAPCIFDDAAGKHLAGLTQHMRNFVAKLKGGWRPSPTSQRVRSWELADLVVKGLIRNDLGSGLYIAVPPPEGVDPSSWDECRGALVSSKTRGRGRRAPGGSSESRGKAQQRKKGRSRTAGGRANSAVEQPSQSPLHDAALGQLLEALRLHVGRDQASAAGSSGSTGPDAAPDAASSAPATGTAHAGSGFRGAGALGRGVSWLADDVEESAWDPQRSAEALFDLRPLPGPDPGTDPGLGANFELHGAPSHGSSHDGCAHTLDTPGIATSPGTSGCVGASRSSAPPTLQSITDMLLLLSDRLHAVERWVESKHDTAAVTTTVNVTTPAGAASGSGASDSPHAESEPDSEDGTSNLLQVSA